MSDGADRQSLELELTEAEKRLEEIKARWPFHDPKPALWDEREEAEEAIKGIKSQIAALRAEKP